MERNAAIAAEAFFTTGSRGFERVENEVRGLRHLGAGREAARQAPLSAGGSAAAPAAAASGALPVRGGMSGTAPRTTLEGFTNATEAPVREPPRPKTSSNMLMRHGVQLPEPRASRSTFAAHPMHEAALIAEDSIGGFVAARRQCMRQLDEIVIAVHAKRNAVDATAAKFIDTDFLLGERDSLYPEGTAPDSQVGVPDDVGRLSQLFPNVPVIGSATTGGDLNAAVIATGTASLEGSQRPKAAAGGGMAFLCEEDGDQDKDESAADLDSDAARADGADDDTNPAFRGNGPHDDRRCFDELRVGQLGDAHFAASVTAVASSAAQPAGRELIRRLFVMPRSLEQAQRAVSMAGAVALDEGRFRDPSVPTPFDDFTVAKGTVALPAPKLAEATPQVVADIGAVGCLLFVDGRWEWVIVDDTIALATAGSKHPLFMHVVPRPPPNALATHVSVNVGLHKDSATKPAAHAAADSRMPTELWPFLLEKAFAKLHGCFDGIDGGLPREALSTLTGAPEFRFDIHRPPDASPCPVQRLPTHLPHALGGDDVPARRSAQTSAATGAGRSTFAERGPASAATPKSAPFTASYHVFCSAVFEADDNVPVCVATARGKPSRADDLQQRVRLDAVMREREDELRNMPAAESRLLTAQHRAHDTAVALVQHGALYPLVRCWRSEVDGVGRVELYDPWSPAEQVADYNAAIAAARRERHVAKLLVEAQRGRRSEAAVHRYARSPLTVKRGSLGRFFTLRWDDFVDLFSHVEGVRLAADPLLSPTRLSACLTAGDPVASSTHAVQGFALAPATVAASNDPNELLQDAVQPFVIKFEAPVRGTLDILLAQRDPKTADVGFDSGSRHYVRKHMPYCMMALSVLRFPLDCDPCQLFKDNLSSRTAVGIQSAIDRVLFRSPLASLVHASPTVYARQYSAQIDADAGFYLLIPRIMKGPATPFTVRVCARATAVLGMRKLPLPAMAESSVLENAAAGAVSEPLYLKAAKEAPVADKSGRVSVGAGQGPAHGIDGGPEESDSEVPAFIRNAMARVQSDRDKLAKFQAAQQRRAKDGALVVHADADGAESDDDEPASIRRAREARATGGRGAREPVLTADGAGGVTTARLPRPSSVDAANPDHGGCGNGPPNQMLAMLSSKPTAADHQVPPATVSGKFDETENVDEAARKLRGDSHAGQSGRDVVQYVVDETFGEVDVLGTGSLRDAAHVDRAVGHLLLHHTVVGQQLRAAAQAALCDASAAGSGLTQADFAKALVEVLGATQQHGAL